MIPAPTCNADAQRASLKTSTIPVDKSDDKIP
jgi:hypothetical protein